MLVFNDFLDGGDSLDLIVVHKRDVFIFEDLFPSSLLVHLLNDYLFATLGVFCSEERVGFGLCYLFKDTILLHNFIINSSKYFLVDGDREKYQMCYDVGFGGRKIDLRIIIIKKWFE